MIRKMRPNYNGSDVGETAKQERSDYKFYVCFLLGLQMALLSCVDPIRLDLNEGDKKLVVEGWITNQPGQYKVRLSYTSGYKTGSEGINLGVRGAKVSILDDLNHSFSLEEYSSGSYFSNPTELQGEVGRSYRLKIQIGEKVYESSPELLKSVPDIDSIYYQFEEESMGKEEGFRVYVDVKDPGDDENFYKWTYEVFSFRDVCINEEQRDTSQCCTPCWDVARCNSCINVLADLYSNGRTITKKEVTTIPYTSTDKVAIKIYQHSLSKEVYKILNAVNEQNNRNGSVFDPPPFVIQGNVFNVNNREEVVLGFFGASSVKIGSKIVLRSGVNKRPQGVQKLEVPPAMGPPPPCNVCREDISQTQIAPPKWY